MTTTLQNILQAAHETGQPQLIAAFLRHAQDLADSAQIEFPNGYMMWTGEFSALAQAIERGPVPQSQEADNAVRVA